MKMHWEILITGNNIYLMLVIEKIDKKNKGDRGDISAEAYQKYSKKPSSW